MAPLDTEGLTQLAGTVAQVRVGLRQTAPARHQLDACYGLDGAQQHRVRRAFARGHEVEVPVHAINEEDVGKARRAEHDFRACGAPTRPGVGSPIFGASIRLGLHDPARDHAGAGLVYQQLADHIACHLEHGARVKVSR